jgi:hypothetical protein
LDRERQENQRTSGEELRHTAEMMRAASFGFELQRLRDNVLSARSEAEAARTRADDLLVALERLQQESGLSSQEARRRMGRQRWHAQNEASHKAEGGQQT